MHRTIFTVDTWVAGAFGVVLVAAPQLLFTLYGVNAESVVVIVTAFMLGLGFGSLGGGRLSARSRLPLLGVF